MVDLTELNAGIEYVFSIKQSDDVYEAVIEIEAGLSSDTKIAIGTVKSSTYPIEDGWEGTQFRLHKDGTVEVPSDPFGPVGQIVDVKET